MKLLKINSVHHNEPVFIPKDYIERIVPVEDDRWPSSTPDKRKVRSHVYYRSAQHDGLMSTPYLCSDTAQALAKQFDSD